MKPRKKPKQENKDKALLEEILNKEHPLYKLAEKIEWEVFEKEFGEYYVEMIGRPGLPIRLMVGLHYLKYLYNVGDEAVIEGFLENPYWQYFCGYEYFQHKFPCDPTSLVRWRRRLGAEGIEKLLKETIEVAKREKELKSKDLERVNVDTTVQEKAIAFPTDARLYYKMRSTLVRQAEKENIKLRQSYKRVGKKALKKQASYAYAKQGQRARKQTKRLQIMLGRVIRDIERKTPTQSQEMKKLLEIAKQIFSQKKDDSRKIYSVHSAEVECITKGKIEKHYEFGAKVSIVTSSKKGYVLAIDALEQNVYDGASLIDSINKMQKIVGQRPKQLFADKGYRGTQHHPKDVEVYICGRKNLSTSLNAWLRRRSAIEPVIGHLKLDHRMDRNFLLGRTGDRINCILAASAFNLRKILRAFSFVLFSWLSFICFGSKKEASNHVFESPFSFA
jgi:IS5 family transposase